MAGVYFSTLPEAIKEAKHRAKAEISTYYVYQAEREAPNLFCSKKRPGQGSGVKAKVLYDGSTVYFGDVEETQDGTHHPTH